MTGPLPEPRPDRPGSSPMTLPHARPALAALVLALLPLTAAAEAPDDIAALGTWLHAHAAGRVVAVNWTGPTDEELDGPRAVALLAETLGFPRTADHGRYRIDVF